jgi:hypothetical protein
MDSSRQIRDDTSVERAPNRSRQVRRSISRRQRNAALLPSSPDRHPILQHAAIQECAQHRERAVAEAGLLLKPSSLNAKTLLLPRTSFAQAHARANGPGTNAKTALCSFHFYATSTSRLPTARIVCRGDGCAPHADDFIVR